MVVKNANKFELRALKALAIVSRIQDWCDNNELPSHSDIVKAIEHPFRPGHSDLLRPFVEHCREYPSRETFRMVELFLKRFTVIDNYHDMELE